jgi:hypothetical protein
MAQMGVLLDSASTYTTGVLNSSVFMKTFLIILFLSAYVFCVIARVGGHYVHALPLMAMAIYITGLFTGKSSGVSCD